MRVTVYVANATCTWFAFFSDSDSRVDCNFSKSFLLVSPQIPLVP